MDGTNCYFSVFKLWFTLRASASEVTPGSSILFDSRLRDTIWGMLRTPNVVALSAQLHQTTATKDGAQIERYLVRARSQTE